MEEETTIDTEQASDEDVNNADYPTPSGFPGIITVLGELQPESVITEEGMSWLFERHPTSVKRAVERGELPSPTRLFGQNAWTAGALVRHIERRLERAAEEAEQWAQKVKHLSP